MRCDGFNDFWDVCKAASRQGRAVVIHCNQSFHRGPLALAAIMKRAGYSSEGSDRFDAVICVWKFSAWMKMLSTKLSTNVALCLYTPKSTIRIGRVIELLLSTLVVTRGSRFVLRGLCFMACGLWLWLCLWSWLSRCLCLSLWV